ncbi:MAG: diacylglycerol kinase family protein [Erysipelothrix sp.]|nr:diacylglycerol kinase family protein [Erysipelothrix sp.]
MKLLKRITSKFNHAFNGIIDGLVNDRSIKIQIGFMVIAIFMAWLYKVTVIEWIIIIIVSTIVVGFEFLNSSIELLADFASNTKYSIIIKRVKDLAAAAVFIVAMCAFLVGVIIFKKYIF